MKTFGLRAGLAAATFAGALVASGPADADALPTPAMAGPLAANASPYSLDLPDWLGDAGGKIYVGGAVTGLAFWQSNFATLSVDHASLIDLDNGQITIQKTDGWLQFFVQAGAYSFPTIGTPYTKSSVTEPLSFGYLPVAYVKLQGQGDMSAWSFTAGKLPTLIGDEYPFTYQNMNIERGLLWNVEPIISRGVQLNYSNGPLNASLSWNDGLYGNNFNWLSGLLSYGFNSGADTVAFSAGGNLGGHNGSLLNQGNVFDLIYTHISGPWVISPYIQYITTPSAFLTSSTEEWGGALLVTYSFDDNWKLAGRAEYETSSGFTDIFAPNIIGYGAGSNAWSFTLTPTYQWKQFFGRAEISYIGAGSITPGDAFGAAGTNTDQVRLMFETGILL